MQKTECPVDHPLKIIQSIVLMVIALLCVPSQISAQQGFDASMIAEKLVEAGEDEQTQLYSELHAELMMMEKDRAIANVNLLIEALPKSSKRVATRAIALKAQLLNHHGEFDESINFIDQAIERAKSTQDTLLSYQMYNEKGTIYEETNHYDLAIQTFLASAELLKDSKNYRLFADIYLRIGNLQFTYCRIVSISDFTDPINNLRVAVKVIETKLDPDATVLFSKMNALNTIALCYTEMNNYDSAFKYYDKALEIAQELNNTFWVALVNGNTATLYLNQGKLDKALAYFKNDKIISLETGEQMSAVKASLSIAEIYIRKSYYDSASRELDFAENLSQNSRNPNVLQLLFQTQTNYYKALKDWENAFEYQSKFMSIQDSLNTIHLSDKLKSIENQYKLNLKEAENELLANKNVLLTRQVLYRNIITVIGVVIISLIVLTAVVFYKQLKVQRHLSDQLSSKNKEIQKQALELEEMNEGLEQMVLQRTKKIQEQNETLREYAFSNSHIVRAPLARIMGLSQLLTENHELSNEKRRELQENIKSSASELDGIIRSLGKILTDNDPKGK